MPLTRFAACSTDDITKALIKLKIKSQIKISHYAGVSQRDAEYKKMLADLRRLLPLQISLTSYSHDDLISGYEKQFKVDERVKIFLTNYNKSAAQMRFNETKYSKSLKSHFFEDSKISWYRIMCVILITADIAAGEWASDTTEQVVKWYKWGYNFLLSNAMIAWVEAKGGWRQMDPLKTMQAQLESLDTQIQHTSDILQTHLAERFPEIHKIFTAAKVDYKGTQIYNHLSKHVKEISETEDNKLFLEHFNATFKTWKTKKSLANREEKFSELVESWIQLSSHLNWKRIVMVIAIMSSLFECYSKHSKQPFSFCKTLLLNKFIIAWIQAVGGWKTLPASLDDEELISIRPGDEPNSRVIVPAQATRHEQTEELQESAKKFYQWQLLSPGNEAGTIEDVTLDETSQHSSSLSQEEEDVSAGNAEIYRPLERLEAAGCKSVDEGAESKTQESTTSVFEPMPMEEIEKLIKDLSADTISQQAAEPIDTSCEGISSQWQASEPINISCDRINAPGPVAFRTEGNIQTLQAPAPINFPLEGISAQLIDPIPGQIAVYMTPTSILPVQGKGIEAMSSQDIDKLIKTCAELASRRSETDTQQAPRPIEITCVGVNPSGSAAYGSEGGFIQGPAPVPTGEGDLESLQTVVSIAEGSSSVSFSDMSGKISSHRQLSEAELRKLMDDSETADWIEMSDELLAENTEQDITASTPQNGNVVPALSTNKSVRPAIPKPRKQRKLKVSKSSESANIVKGKKPRRSKTVAPKPPKTGKSSKRTSQTGGKRPSTSKIADDQGGNDKPKKRKEESSDEWIDHDDDDDVLVWEDDEMFPTRRPRAEVEREEREQAARKREKAARKREQRRKSLTLKAGESKAGESAAGESAAPCEEAMVEEELPGEEGGEVNQFFRAMRDLG